MKDVYRHHRFIAAATAVLIGGAGIAGCTASGENSTSSTYTQAIGLSPGDIPSLLGKKGLDAERQAWSEVESEVKPGGTSVSVGVGYDGTIVTQRQAMTEADSLDALAAKELHLTADPSADQAYYPAEAGVGTISVVTPQPSSN